MSTTTGTVAPRQRRGGTRKEYNRYTYGEKTPKTRQAKADYMRAKRAEARRLRMAAEARGETYIVEGIKHGYGGYQDYQCRCPTCLQGKADAMARQTRPSRRRRRSDVSADGVRHANTVS